MSTSIQQNASRLKTSHHQDAYISQTYVLLLVEYIKHHHPTPDIMLDNLGILPYTTASYHQINSSDNNTKRIKGRIPFAEFTAMLHRIQHEMKEPNLAVEIGRHISAAHFGVLGYLILACANMAEALLLLNRYARLLDDRYTMTTTQVDDVVILSWDTANEADPLFFEMGLAAMVQFMRNLTGSNAPLCEVHLTSKHLAQAKAIETFYDCPVKFEQPEMRLKLPITLLATPIKQADQVLLSLLSAQADQALAALPQDGEWTQKVRQEIVRLCHEDTPTLAKVAGNLFLTPRTLQRHLAHEGLRFQPLLDETRLRLAEQYLNEGRLQLTDIAELLGYSDQSALTRAFKRWTGNTPKDIRK
ncbi:MAG: AraC family transcriptional regulator [Candidatus Saccharibacteria bacterium]|nr:AraC family transcriptional regulator [Moraxellaceae bacterium]